uniref:Uncharacterized protein n=3 Tax=Daucus carota subsp. sativus TaxID=79200 RepID=A0A166EZP1_DAUCS
MPNGWPLGLENMSTKLVLAPADSSSQATEAASEPSSTCHVPSYSFSSFASSGLDTESTASFFIDQSVTLGRLIGMNPIPGKSRASQTGHEMKVEQESGDIICVNGDKEMFRGICVPLLQNIMVLRSKSKGSSRY